MSKLIIHKGLRVSYSPFGGFGVFTDVPITKNSIVEQCYALTFEDLMIDDLPKLLQQYVYNSGNGKSICFPLGFGMIYNQNNPSNLYFRHEILDVNGEPKPVLTFMANRDIEPGEELFSYYGEVYFKHFNIKEIKL